jgi:hypothetical protein
MSNERAMVRGFYLFTRRSASCDAASMSAGSASDLNGVGSDGPKPGSPIRMEKWRSITLKVP